MMKIVRLVSVAACAALVLWSCTQQQDSTSGNQQTQDPTGGLVGTWFSGGADVAPLLRANPSFLIDSIAATFNADNTYRVLAYARGLPVTTFTGNFTATRSDKDTLGARIYTIDLRQATPSVVRSQGIYVVQTSVSPARMLYEVIQTETPAGIAPTVAGGFGSSRTTQGVPLVGMLSNIQVYRKR